jgi:bifunctional DNA-binding transcriptional regulator/antitoxin component of YhaV-PrlF toxin-antitoxin module
MDEKCSDFKTVRVTSKRQLTIPKKYFEALQIGERARCYMQGEKLVIEPAGVDEFWDFTSDILKELVDENYTGKDLLREFEVRKEKTGQGLERMVAEAREDVKAGRGRPVQDIIPLLLGEDDV